MSARQPCRLAAFPRLREIRETLLGWEVAELAGRLNHRPGIATIYRLEQGQAIRPASARRLFDVVNAGLNNALDISHELIFKQSEGSRNVSRELPSLVSHSQYSIGH